MKKVCHIISAFHRFDTRIFWKQCRSLAKSGYQVTIIVNDNGEKEIKEGVAIIPTGFAGTNRMRRILFSSNGILKKAADIDADYYQIHDPELLPVGLKLIAKGKKVIYDSHEDFPQQLLEKTWLPRLIRLILSKGFAFYYKKHLDKFEKVISVTPHIVNSLKKYTPSVELITNYPIIEDNHEEFNEQEYISRKNTLCYAGTVYTNSLQENIINALNDIHNIKYQIVGTIDENYKTKLTMLPSWKKVQFIERVPKEELLQIYKRATIGIVIFDYTPNVGYKLGTLGNNKIFEYMHAGLPIICTDFVLWKEFVEKYNCGICVNPNSIYETKSAINYLLENKNLAFTMGQNGRKAVLEEFNWSTQEHKYLKIFE